MKEKIKITETDVLIIVDFQNDFCPGGALPVPEGDKIGPAINKVIPLFIWKAATQDWHPENHCSFEKNGGSWPMHCIAGTEGAELHPSLDLKQSALISIKKATEKDKEAYSAFGEAIANISRRQRRIKRIFVCGLATDYCVKATVLDGLKERFEVFVILDAIRAVNVNPGDGEKALDEMKKAGAKLISSSSLEK